MAKRTLLLLSSSIIAIEILLAVIHYKQLIYFVTHYFWVAPLVIFKSFFKQFLLLNVFGLAKVLMALCVHFLRLLLLWCIKFLGLRYGAHFSTNRWRKTTQRLRIIKKIATKKQRQLNRFFQTWTKTEYTIVVIAFFPLVVILFVLGITSRFSREMMMKKGSEFGVTQVALKTAQKSAGLISCLKRGDTWVLAKIDALAPQQSRDNHKG